MERTIGVEAARGKLGELAAEVAGGGDPVILSRRGRADAVLVSRVEYLRFKEARSRAAREELEALLPRIREQVERSGLDPVHVLHALEAVRRLG